MQGLLQLSADAKDQALQLEQRGTGWGVMTRHDAVQEDLCSVAEHLQR